MSALFAIGLAVLGAAGGGTVDVYATLDPPVVPFHRKAEYSIVVEAPNDVEVKLPDMLEHVGGLAVADVRRDTENLRGGRKRITETYVLDPILVGDYRIEPAQVLYGEDGATTVPSLSLRVRELTEAEHEAAMRFEDIADAMPVVGFFGLYGKWLAGVGLAALGLIGAAVYLFRRRRRIERAAPPRPPWELAYQRLQELDERQLPKAGKFGPYYVDLSAILRYYIEDRFSLHAPEQTTPEFIGAASNSGALSDAHQKLLAGFLRHCDRVKFAQYVPTENEMEHSFATVLQFVEETVPQKEDAEEDAEEEEAA
ncbi:MAG: hypothetical protein GWP08_02395 [Nitrospiraceae bacterium]|nr:hypothetical protein [Nitrospiraceae bacterium]